MMKIDDGVDSDGDDKEEEEDDEFRQRIRRMTRILSLNYKIRIIIMMMMILSNKQWEIMMLSVSNQILLPSPLIDYLPRLLMSGQ